MNNWIGIGRLTKDVELSYSKDSMAIAKFTLAIDRETKRDEADFIRVVVFGKQAENCDKYIGKGKQVAVIGRIQTGSYEKDGVKHYTTDIIANRVEFLGGKQQEEAHGFREVEEDMPF